MTTKLLIDRELLEQVASEFEHDNDRYMLGRELRKILDAPRQTEGEGLKVVGWHHSHAEVATSDKARVVTWLPECVEPLCRLSDAQRAIAELREECERLRGECARLESKYERDVWGLNNEGDPIGGDHPSGFANDLLRVTIERDTLRQQLAETRDSLECAVFRGDHHSGLLKEVLAQRDKLAGLLYEASGELRTDRHHGLGSRIDAALAEVKPCQESPHIHACNDCRHLLPKSTQPAEVGELVEALRAADEYLSSNRFNEIGSGSILHRQMQAALAKLEGRA